MKNERKKPEIIERMGLTRKNLAIFTAGIVSIILGYLFLATGKTNDVWSLTVGPVLLVLGYVVLLPIALAFTDKRHLPGK